MKHIHSVFAMFIIPLVLILSMAFQLTVFEEQQSRRQINTYYERMEDANQKREKTLAITLETPFSLMEALAGEPVFHAPEELELSQIAERMNELMDITTLDELYFLESNGSFLHLSGKLTKPSTDCANTILKTDGRLLLRTDCGKNRPNEWFYLCVPVYKGITKLGVLVGAYTSESFAGLIDGCWMSESNDCACFLVDEQGNVMLLSASDGAYFAIDNFFEYCQSATIGNGYTYYSMISALENGEAVRTSISKDSDYSFVAASTINIDSFDMPTWYMVETTSSLALRNDLKTTKSFTRFSLIVTLIVALLVELLLLRQHRDSEKLLEQAEYDMMTGLFNRATTFARVRYMISRNTGVGCALLVIDIDDLKGYNDRWGHSVGDEAIIGMANTLKQSFRESDILGRIGGDEFMVFLNGVTDKASLVPILKRLKSIIVSTPIADGKAYLGGSIGCAMGVSGKTSIDDLYRWADEALYAVKATGKNDYAFYEESSALPDSGI